MGQLIYILTLTGLAVAGFIVPLVSVLDALNFIPSAEEEREFPYNTISIQCNNTSLRWQPQTYRHKKVWLTDVCRHHELFNLLIVRVINKRCERIPTHRAHRCGQDAALEDREQDTGLGFGAKMLSSVRLPLVIGRRPPQKHDDQQNDGEEEPPESIIHPQLHPVLLINTHEPVLNHLVLLQSEQSYKLRDFRYSLPDSLLSGTSLLSKPWKWWRLKHAIYESPWLGLIIQLYSGIFACAILTENSKDECVGEVSVQRQLHWVSSEFQSLNSLCQTDKYVRYSQGIESLTYRTIILGI